MRYTQSRSVEGAPNSVNNILAKRESRRVPPILRLRTAKQLTTTPPSCLDEVYDINPEYDDPKRNTGQNDANEEDTPNFEGHRPPLATFNLLRILPKVEIYARSTLFIRNPQESGPQTDICARIPGNDNNWAARVSCYDSLFDLYDWVRGNSSEESPEIWMYVSNIPHTFVNIKDILTVSLNEPVSIVAFANSVNPLPSGWTLVSLSPRPLLPGLREISGEDGAEWSE
ncbi:hypothetical protein NW756_007022 [Fusarium oxysporum]|nr:hypothetical protein NW753_001753 [Fusarium oxysporum]KAJ4072184.1 hypothetical protein NW763_001211 [Fusarium oxysporum]KAJ4088626.1 hypothetical protein NW756_007022 [Fusarium oxysporum]KAJ4116287.1 hypothetical protein NW769_003353 [Fusarium oxysporum]KAJ4224935.1 hypothetical protein NW760_009403 [Fusarium oxysporum]